MADSPIETTEVRDVRTGRLHKGAKLPGAGRPKGSKNWSVRALAEQLRLNPFILSLEILKTQHLPPTEPGKKGRMVSTGEYIKILIEIQTYLAAKLQATTITGKDDSPVAIATCDVTELMKDPALAEAGQLIAIELARQQQAQLEPAANDPTDPGAGSGPWR